MNPHDIKAALAKAGSSETKIANDNGVTVPMIHKVIFGASRSRRLEKAIADVTGLPLETLWPDHYGDRRSA